MKTSGWPFGCEAWELLVAESSGSVPKDKEDYCDDFHPYLAGCHCHPSLFPPTGWCFFALAN